MGVGGARGTGSLTHESSVMGHSSAPKEPLLKSRSDPPEVTERSRLGVGQTKKWAQSALAWMARVTGPRTQYLFLLQ